VQVAAFQAKVSPDADGTLNPSRVCLGQLCLVSDGGTGMFVQNKARSMTVARFSVDTNGELFNIFLNANGQAPYFRVYAPNQGYFGIWDGHRDSGTALAATICLSSDLCIRGDGAGTLTFNGYSGDRTIMSLNANPGAWNRVVFYLDPQNHPGDTPYFYANSGQFSGITRR
jgi:hypothetical protein